MIDLRGIWTEVKRLIESEEIDLYTYVCNIYNRVCRLHFLHYYNFLISKVITLTFHVRSERVRDVVAN